MGPMGPMGYALPYPYPYPYPGLSSPIPGEVIKRYTAIWGPILDRFEQLVRQIRPQGHPDAMAGVLDPRNAKICAKITWVCAIAPPYQPSGWPINPA